MTKILHIESSSQTSGSSHSRKVSLQVVQRIQELMGGKIVSRDLARPTLPHVNDAFVEAMFVTTEDRTAEQSLALALSETLIQELESADAVVIGCPMYNYSIPSALKAWLDHVVRARRTFVHTPEGPRGLLRDRPTYIVTSSGGVYREGPGTKFDFLSPYLSAVLGKMGLHDLRFVQVEGVALGGDVLKAAMQRVNADIASVSVASRAESARAN
jgi:FMN-dependent NADH-azoreductase